MGITLIYKGKRLFSRNILFFRWEDDYSFVRLSELYKFILVLIFNKLI